MDLDYLISELDKIYSELQILIDVKTHSFDFDSTSPPLESSELLKIIWTQKLLEHLFDKADELACRLEYFEHEDDCPISSNALAQLRSTPYFKLYGPFIYNLSNSIRELIKKVSLVEGVRAKNIAMETFLLDTKGMESSEVLNSWKDDLEEHKNKSSFGKKSYKIISANIPYLESTVQQMQNQVWPLLVPHYEMDHGYNDENREKMAKATIDLYKIISSLYDFSNKCLSDFKAAADYHTTIKALNGLSSFYIEKLCDLKVFCLDDFVKDDSNESTKNPNLSVVDLQDKIFLKMNEYNLIKEAKDNIRYREKELLVGDLEDAIEVGQIDQNKYHWYGFVYDQIKIFHPMSIIKDLLLAYSRTDYNVLIKGERGTGKELAAEAIAKLSSQQQKKEIPFFSFNCASLTNTLADSLLFGHEKGSFTGADSQHIGLFEKSDNGILFLDEVGSLPKASQSKLLRALQTGCFYRVGSTKEINANVRIIAATNENIESLSFRQDLKDRIGQLSIEMPPLKSHWEDIPIIAIHYVEQEAKKFIPKGTISSLDEIKLTPDEILGLLKSDYPGNVRQLLNDVRMIITRKISFSASRHFSHRSSTNDRKFLSLTATEYIGNQSVSKSYEKLLDDLDGLDLMVSGKEPFSEETLKLWKKKDKSEPEKVSLEERIRKYVKRKQKPDTTT